MLMEILNDHVSICHCPVRAQQLIAPQHLKCYVSLYKLQSRSAHTARLEFKQKKTSPW